MAAILNVPSLTQMATMADSRFRFNLYDRTIFPLLIRFLMIFQLIFFQSQSQYYCKLYSFIPAFVKQKTIVPTDSLNKKINKIKQLSQKWLPYEL